jgi:hypothetical protein
MGGYSPCHRHSVQIKCYPMQNTHPYLLFSWYSSYSHLTIIQGCQQWERGGCLPIQVQTRPVTVVTCCDDTFIFRRYMHSHMLFMFDCSFYHVYHCYAKTLLFIVTGHTALLLCYIHIHLFVSLWHLLLCFDISLIPHFLTCFMLTYHWSWRRSAA